MNYSLILSRASAKPSKQPKYLRLDRAIELMHHRDARLALMHVTGGGKEWFVLPKGGPVKSADAEKILARPDICAMEDGLWPGLSQTWRMVR
jgi:hypothetical protein